jgi:glycerol-3-phosphate dehydrogenase (NAD(P)+)
MAHQKIAVLGDGGWGTALALVLSRKKIPVTVWGVFPNYLKEVESSRINSKFLPHIVLPREISFNADLQAVFEDNDIIIVAVPTAYLRITLEKVKNIKTSSKIIVSCTKGIENGSLLRPSEIIRSIFPEVAIAVLSGPSHAEEVAKNIPTCVVSSAESKETARLIQELFMEDRFRVYTTSDVIGVEMGGALKNVIAIAAGICDGLDFGSNTKAALLSRGLQEIVRLGNQMGACTETFFGLSGMGDLVTTCISQFGRNRFVGERIGRGEKLADILNSMEMVAEGVNTTRSAFDLSKKYAIEMPITREVFSLLFENKDPLESISDLMLRQSKDEM